MRFKPAAGAQEFTLLTLDDASCKSALQRVALTLPLRAGATLSAHYDGPLVAAPTEALADSAAPSAPVPAEIVLWGYQTSQLSLAQAKLLAEAA